MRPLRAKHNCTGCTLNFRTLLVKEEQKEAIDVFDVMANLATVPVGTPSLLDHEDDDMTPVERVSEAKNKS